MTIHRPKLSNNDLAQALLRVYELDEMTCSVIRIRRGTVTKLRTGGVVSTPYGSVSAATLLYIMVYKTHPKDDEYNRAVRMKTIKGMLPPATTHRNPKPKSEQPVLKTADKIDLLRAALLAHDNRLLAQDVRITELEYKLTAILNKLNTTNHED